MKEAKLQKKKEMYSLEVHKLIIDFNKALITIATSILTAIIVYVVHQGIVLNTLNYLCIGFFIVSLFFSFMGFGKAIPTHFEKTIKNKSVLFTNISGGLLITGIILLLTFRNNPQNSVDHILNRIEKTTTSLNYDLSKNNFTKIELKNGNYVIHYSIDTICKEVKYSIEDNKIVAIQ